MLNKLLYAIFRKPELRRWRSRNFRPGSSPLPCLALPSRALPCPALPRWFKRT